MQYRYEKHKWALIVPTWAYIVFIMFQWLLKNVFTPAVPVYVRPWQGGKFECSLDREWSCRMHTWKRSELFSSSWSRHRSHSPSWHLVIESQTRLISVNTVFPFVTVPFAHIVLPLPGMPFVPLPLDSQTKLRWSLKLSLSALSQ